MIVDGTTSLPCQQVEFFKRDGYKQSTFYLLYFRQPGLSLGKVDRAKVPNLPIKLVSH